MKEAEIRIHFREYDEQDANLEHHSQISNFWNTQANTVAA